MTTAIEKTEMDLPLAARSDAVPSVASMLQAVIQGGVSNENVAALEKLVGLYERMQDRDAEKDFNRSFAALQGDLPVIVAKTVIQNRGKYERFEDVMHAVGPVLGKHGFAVSFSMDAKDGRVIVTCHLKHSGGHSESNAFAVRVGKADTETQADCKAATTAKRNALLQALNIVIRQDAMQSEDDATLEGDPDAVVTKEQAEELEHRCQMTNSKIPTFLKLAGAESFARIPARNYDLLDRMLGEKERAGK